MEKCQTAISNVYEENELGSDIGASKTAKRVEYPFATTSRGILYWAVADNSEADWGQTYWRKLQGFKNDLDPDSLVGCAVFKTSAQHRYLILFAKTTKDGEDKLEFLRLDLERGGWDSDATEISIDDARDKTSFDVILKARGETEKEEATAPTLFITYSDNTRYRYTLGQKGDTDKSTAQLVGTTQYWSGRMEMDRGLVAPLHIWFVPSKNNWHAYVSGTSICAWEFGGTTRLLVYWAEQKSIAQQNGRNGDDPHYP